MSRRALLVGYYGMKNFGDDLFVLLITSLRPALTPETRILVAGPRLSGSRVRGVSFMVPRPLSRAFRSDSRLGSFMRLATGLVGAALCGTVVLGGGSVLTELRGARAAQFRLRKLLGVHRWVALGVSIGPYGSDGGHSLRPLLEAFETLVVRDSRSAAISGRQAVMGGDLAGLLPLSFLSPPHRQRSGIVYAPKHSAGPHTHEAALSAICEASRSMQTPVTVLALNCHEQEGDLAACGEAARFVAESGVPVRTLKYTDLGVQGTVDLLASASAVVTGRLHGGIVSFICGTPFVLVSDSPKMDDFLDEIEMPLTLRANPDTGTGAAVRRLLAGREPVLSSTSYVVRAASAYKVKRQAR